MIGFKKLNNCLLPPVTKNKSWFTCKTLMQKAYKKTCRSSYDIFFLGLSMQEG